MKTGLVENARNEVEHLFPGVREPAGSYDHHEHLEDFEARRTQAEGEHILIAADGMVLGKTGNVIRIIEVSFPIGRDEAGIVLTEAFEAPALRRRDMRFPVGAPEATVRFRLDLDAAVDYRDEVRVSDKVKNAPTPGAIHATEENVAIERGTKSFFLPDAQLQLVN
jgi:hypothetical protein